MTIRDRISLALEGGEPDVTPYSIYPMFVQESDDRWRRLFDAGLGVCESVCTCREVRHGVSDEHIDEVSGGRGRHIHRLHTPVGTVEAKWVDGWTIEHYIKRPQDYKVIQWIAENTELQSDFGDFASQEERIGNRGIVMHSPGRTPHLAVNVDLAGCERYCLDYALEVPELFECIDVMNGRFLEKMSIIASGQGTYVRLLENLTADTLGPDWYERALLPIYRQADQILASAGKKLMVHYDGRLRCVKDEIARAPVAVIESLTEPPEGDMLYDECRAAWPDKSIWANISLQSYYLPPQPLREDVIAKRERAGKKGLAFEISEDLPANWFESIPVVLDTLEELG